MDGKPDPIPPTVPHIRVGGPIKKRQRPMRAWFAAAAIIFACGILVGVLASDLYKSPAPAHHAPTATTAAPAKPGKSWPKRGLVARAGDTFPSLAKEYSVSLEALLKANSAIADEAEKNCRAWEISPTRKAISPPDRCEVVTVGNATYLVNDLHGGDKINKPPDPAVASSTAPTP